MKQLVSIYENASKQLLKTIEKRIKSSAFNLLVLINIIKVVICLLNSVANTEKIDRGEHCSDFSFFIY